jgi:hypothetical protein
MLRQLVLGATLAATAALPAAAQGGRVTVGPRLGYIKYQSKTGMKSSGMLGLDGVYHLTRNFGVGFMLDVARPETDGAFFPAELSFGDTTFVFQVSQPLTVVQYAAQFLATTGGRFAPFVSGSVGGYRVTLDPQISAGNESFSKLGFSIGGGIDLQIGQSGGVRLEARDFIFTKFDRARLNPVREANQPARFPEVIPTPAPFEGSAHNLMVALGFTFTPGGSR